MLTLVRNVVVCGQTMMSEPHVVGYQLHHKDEWRHSDSQLYVGEHNVPLTAPWNLSVFHHTAEEHRQYQKQASCYKAQVVEH